MTTAVFGSAACRNTPSTHKRGGSLVDPLRQDLQNADGDIAAGERQPLQQEAPRLVDPHLVRSPVLQSKANELSAATQKHKTQLRLSSALIILSTRGGVYSCRA